jgi:AcrR family transcriptional regulator
MGSDVKPRTRGRPSKGAREALLDAGRELFAERGYDAVSTSEIVARSGVSKGAMYHHFPGKRELFEAVYIQVEDATVQRLLAEAGEGTPLAVLRSGTEVYLREAARDGDFARISLTQARPVLGIERWRVIAAERGVGVVRALLGAAVEAGELGPLDLDAGAAIYTAAVIEAGLLVVAAEDQVAMQRVAGEVLERMLAGLGAPPV